MTVEEKKAKKAAYMLQWKKNLSRFQKEKRRLQNNEYRRKARKNWTPEQLEKDKERNKNYYYANLDKIKAYNKIYRASKKKELC